MLLNYTDGEGRRYWSAEADPQGIGTLQVSRSKYAQLTSSNTISYGKYVNEHNFNILGGFEAISNSYNSLLYLFTRCGSGHSFPQYRNFRNRPG